MFLNFSIKSIIRICFYLILIVVCVTSWIKLLKEPTAFEEKVVDDQARLPSFTFCPSHHNDPISNKAIESFEDIEEAINHDRNKYTIIIDKHKPYEQAKYGEYNYNDTSYGVWYLAPKISTYSPFDVVICLIWTPSRELKIEPDWSYGVSYHNKLEVSKFQNIQITVIGLNWQCCLVGNSKMVPRILIFSNAMGADYSIET